MNKTDFIMDRAIFSGIKNEKNTKWYFYEKKYSPDARKTLYWPKIHFTNKESWRFDYSFKLNTIENRILNWLTF